MDRKLVKVGLDKGDVSVLIVLRAQHAKTADKPAERELPKGMMFTHHTVDGMSIYTIKVFKLPNDSTGDTVTVYDSRRGWVQKGPWVDIFLDFAEKVYKDLEKEAESYAAHWKIESK